jgi:peptidoglycan/LPS O-acetylase OafA/YrhL
MLDTRSRSDERDRGKRRMLLLIFFECLVCLLIWWRGVVIALSDQPEHRNWDMIQRQRRGDWVRNELQERPVWWLMLTGLMLLVLADWFMDKWEQRPWRAATIWTIVMSIVLVVVVALTEHSGWGVRPIKL